MKRVKIYTYSGYGTLRRASPHEHHTVENAQKTVDAIRERNKFYKHEQLVIIDYTAPRSRIVSIHDPIINRNIHVSV